MWTSKYQPQILFGYNKKYNIANSMIEGKKHISIWWHLHKLVLKFLERTRLSSVRLGKPLTLNEVPGRFICWMNEERSSGCKLNLNFPFSLIWKYLESGLSVSSCVTVFIAL